MKVGDLVKYKDLSAARWVAGPIGAQGGQHRFAEYRGVIIKQIPGWGNNQVVLWANNNLKQSHEAKNLEVINETK